MCGPDLATSAWALRNRAPGRYAMPRRSARCAASGSCARMRIGAIVAGSIMARFCPRFHSVATGIPSVSANACYDRPSRFRIYHGEMMFHSPR